MASADAAANEQPWFLKSACPVLFPHHEALGLPDEEFDEFLKKDLAGRHDSMEDSTSPQLKEVAKSELGTSESFTQIETLVTSTTASNVGIVDKMEEMEVCEGEKDPTDTQHPFVKGLISYEKDKEEETEDPNRDMSNITLTANQDLAHSSSKSPLVDLFYELEEAATGVRLRDLLNGAWAADPLMTLKIVFNARSIHLGKASRTTFYRAAGWLAQEHPLTLISNLKWLSRPVIEKKVTKQKDSGDFEVVMIEDEATGDAAYDVKNGVAHGYWKDLLNLVALAVNGKLDPLADPKDILNITFQRGAGGTTKEQARAKRRRVRGDRHEAALKVFGENPVYRGLYLAVARLFASQLRRDIDAFNSNDPKAKRNISLCAKWAPSTARFHDKHTFIVTSIAELLHPYDPTLMDGDEAIREVAIRNARENYRKTTSTLRGHLDIVERNLTAKTFSEIKYERVPSIAMNNYAKIFATKDTERFDAYLDKVASGQANISGAVLLPSTLISSARRGLDVSDTAANMANLKPKQMVEARMKAMESKVVDNQWKTLVQRIKDSGTLSNSMAVCDVSGSMTGPRFGDGTTPMDSAVGLSLLLAEIAEPPFRGHFITFSSKPQVVSVDLDKGLTQKCNSMLNSSWGMTTDFVAVFEKLILPMAVKSKLSQDEMVKRIFVFSDMQFNEAEPHDYGSTSGTDRWTTSYERVSKAYADAGYEMPQLVFWNLNGAGYSGEAPKPVTVENDGTALVGGYSQGMLKVFLESGSFEEPEAEVVEEEVQDEETGEIAVKVTKKQKMDPLSTVKKAVSHKAYEMLKVVD
ncbi:hypothetical protein MKZ38_008306 [Zalerion maritima]|uniref:Uncharacterized protein n=1 Tax=Zalerion maritima TaxID=339359 RepID=A0AAD5WP75_9PEZI|nr:hypothetical protein MKZ38_008306 [Zalerion maritima]